MFMEAVAQVCDGRELDAIALHKTHLCDDQ